MNNGANSDHLVDSCTAAAECSSAAEKILGNPAGTIDDVKSSDKGNIQNVTALVKVMK